MQLAHRDFITPRGYVLSASYALNPTNDHFSDLISVYGKLYTPGFAPHNSLTAAATYQTSIGGFKNPAGESFLSYKSGSYFCYTNLKDTRVKRSDTTCARTLVVE